MSVGTEPLARKAGWLDHPVMTCLLAVTWLALAQSLALVHLLSAALIGLLVPRMVAGFLVPADPVNIPAAVRLVCVVLWDIVVSNIVVARQVLGPLQRLTPVWVPVTLATRHARLNWLFASIITTTPGTVSCVVDEQRGIIWVHALTGTDPTAMAHDMKQRYERPLMRVLGVSDEPAANPTDQGKEAGA